MSESTIIFTMHKHVYAFTYYLMNSRLPLFIKYFDNPLITFQNIKHNLQIFFFYCRFWKTTRVIFLYVAEIHCKQWICMFQFVHPIVMKIINYFGRIYCIPTNTTKGNLTLLFSYMNIEIVLFIFTVHRELYHTYAFFLWCFYAVIKLKVMNFLQTMV
jgi:hypothetical protein